MSSKMRSRRLFAQPTMQETVKPLLWPHGDCIGSGRKIKYQHPDDVPTRTRDGARVWAYECEFLRLVARDIGAAAHVAHGDEER
jgi:hypothetical protein